MKEIEGDTRGMSVIVLSIFDKINKESTFSNFYGIIFTSIMKGGFINERTVES